MMTVRQARDHGGGIRHRGALRVRRALPALALTGLIATAHATDWELDLDARLVTSDAERPFPEGGYGTERFGSNDEVLQLGRIRLALTQPLGELWSAHLDASMYDARDRSPVGLTEAYLLFRPYPFAGYRFRLNAGGFYAPISLENRASGWESPYTLSSSAINSWLGIELRTLGIEGQLDWLGTRSGHALDLGVTGGVFGWNEGAGAVLADGGLSLTDRQTALFGRVGPRGVPSHGDEPFVQIDSREGFYGGLEARYLDRVVLRVLRYDNRADPTKMDSVSGVFAWDTRFNSAGVRVEADKGWTAIAQWLDGETTIAPFGMPLSWPFKAEFALIAKRFGRQTLSARYDRFTVDTLLGGFEPFGAQDGHAWTAAYVFQPDEHWRFTLEWLQVVSSSYSRADNGGPPLLSETQLQLAIRYALGSTIR
jgi:hypothetical protein